MSHIPFFPAISAKFKSLHVIDGPSVMNFVTHVTVSSVYDIDGWLDFRSSLAEICPVLNRTNH
jgi:hypothetical protein